ncbi:MAG: hypothetical protein HRT47_09605 [Candidatus Caenarcaniphilales bacterium]|nr:hypothetical protein [Candidatus Caenarcaniphilales bacterium]
MRSEELIELYMKSNPHLDGQKLRLKLILEKRDRDLSRNFKKKRVDVADFRDATQAFEE